jgi:hypothetical protein
VVANGDLAGLLTRARAFSYLHNRMELRALESSELAASPTYRSRAIAGNDILQ